MDEPEPIDTQINQMVKKCMIHRFASELQNTTAEERKQSIREILQLLQDPPPKIDSKTKLDQIYENIEKNAVKKQWAKLSQLQKLNKIKDFAKNNQELEAKLSNMLEEGELKKVYIDYNVETGVIIAINLPKLKKSKESKEDSSDESSSDD